MDKVQDSFSIENLSVRIGTKSILRDISLDVAPGEIVGLVGENGAGKSTLLNVLSGILKPTSGSLRSRGVELRLNSYRSATRYGIFRVYQEDSLIHSLTVEQNMFLGQEREFGRGGVMVDRKAMRRATISALDRIGLSCVDPATTVSELPIGTRQFIAIARVIATIDLLGVQNPVILYDEPTTSLDRRREAEFLRIVAEFAAQGAYQFLVSHLLQEILGVTTRVVVLKDGDAVYSGKTEGLDEPRLHELMVGRTHSANYFYADEKSRPDHERPERLSISDYRLHPDHAPTNFSLKEGEIFGLVGLDGSGKSELGEYVAGVRSSFGARAVLDGVSVDFISVRDAIDAGVVYVPADRHHQGLIMNASIEMNVEVGSIHDRFSTLFGFTRRRKIRTATTDLIRRLEIVARSPSQTVDQLSGGNQQKVLLARWIYREPKVIVMDSPTQGVDTGARRALYKEIRQATQRGSSVLVISEDLTEVIGLSDRVGVMKNGELVSVFDAPSGDKPSEQAVLAKML